MSASACTRSMPGWNSHPAGCERVNAHMPVLLRLLLCHSSINKEQVFEAVEFDFDGKRPKLTTV